MILNLLFGIGILVILFIIWLIYEFVIKLYWTAYQLKKMDPTLKIFIQPFAGINQVQKKCIQKYGDSHRFLKDMVKQNPNQIAYLSNLGNRPFLILCDPKLVKQFTLEHKKFRKFNALKHSDKYNQKGIFFAPYDQWKKERSIISHSFSHESLKQMIPVLSNCIKSYIQKINKRIQNCSQNTYKYKVLTQSQVIIGDALVRTFFSQQFANTTIDGKNLSLIVAQLGSQIFEQSKTALNILTILLFGQKARTMSFNKKQRWLQKFIDAVKEEHLAFLDERIAKYNQGEKKDFINNYIGEMISIDKQIQAAQRQGKPHKLKKITREEIVHQIISFYFAGIDTTGHLVAMSIYAAAQYPQCRQKLIEEIERIVPSVEQITYEQCQKMEYMNKFLDECLRMWAPANALLIRTTNQELTIGPFKLPKDFTVSSTILANMYNEKYYKNPQKFDPQRWNDKSMETAQPYSFIPFSAGPRSCIGKYLALTQAKVILTYFLYNYDIERTDRPLRMCAKFLYEPIDEDLVYFRPGGIKSIIKSHI